VVVSPDLMEEIRLLSALSKESELLLDVLEVDEVEDVESSERRELLLCKLEINIKCNPFYAKFLG